MKTAVFIYDVAHVSALPVILKKFGPTEEYDLIACGMDIEFLLEEKNIPFRSARPFLTMDSYERLYEARKLSERIVDENALSFFTYKNISLPSLFRPTLFYYSTTFLYYFDLSINAIESGYAKAILIRGNTDVPESAGVMSALNARAFPDVLALVCAKSNVSLEVVDVSRALLPRASYKQWTAKAKRSFFEFVFDVFNICMRLLPRKKIRILATELWKNIKQMMDELPESELILLDRAQAAHIDFKNILKHRMRFVNTNQFVTAKMRATAKHTKDTFAAEWQEAIKTHGTLQQESFRGCALTPLLTAALERFLIESERVVRDIDGTEAMIEYFGPNVVAVRASISAQTHFAVLCKLARQKGIPSVEIQHGIFSVGLQTETSNRAAEYIAEYGSHERELWQKYNYAPRSKFADVGSPRFDPYIKKEVTRKAPQDGVFKILHMALPFNPGSENDSYDVMDYFTTMATAVRDIPNVHVTIKLRGTRVGEAFFREVIRRAFGTIPYSIKMFESLADLLPFADVVVTCHSTAVLEAMMSHRPVVLDASLPVYKKIAPTDFEESIKAGALLIAESPEVLKEVVQRLANDPQEREAVSEKTAHFMHEKFLFEDGKSSERLANFIRSLINKDM